MCIGLKGVTLSSYLKLIVLQKKIQLITSMAHNGPGFIRLYCSHQDEKLCKQSATLMIFKQTNRRSADSAMVSYMFAIQELRSHLQLYWSGPTEEACKQRSTDFSYSFRVRFRLTTMTSRDDIMLSKQYLLLRVNLVPKLSLLSLGQPGNEVDRIGSFRKPRRRRERHQTKQLCTCVLNLLKNFSVLCKTTT